MPVARILAVDDDPGVLSLMRRGLSLAGYTVDLAANGEEALSIAQERWPDLVVLDVMLPGLDGIEVCRRLRAGGDLPIIMLTAKDRVPDRVLGLDAGADDYLVKPFAFDELLARIRALLRRSQPPEEDRELRFADLTVNPATRDVTRGGRRIELTAKEYDLLEFLMRHPRQVFSKDAIYQHVWGSAFLGESNAIEVHMMRLRDKLEARGEPRLLHTLRGVGYSLREE